MKISRKLETIYIVLILLSLIKFFYFLPLPLDGNSAGNVIFPGVMSIIYFLIYLLIFKRNSNGLFSKEIGIFFLILIINCIYLSRMDIPLKTIIIQSIQYCVLLSYFPLYDYMEKYGVKNIILIIEIISSILGIILLIQEFLLTKENIYFLRTSLPAAYLQKGRIYSVGENIIRINVLLSFYEVIKNNLKIITIPMVSFIVSLSTIIFVDQSRIYLLSVLSGVTVILLFSFKKISFIKRIVGLFVIIVILPFILKNYVTSIMSSLHDPSSGSNFARRGAIEYFSEITKEKMLFGIGYITPQMSDSFFSYFKGPFGYYNFSDLGLIGVYFSRGIIGCIWYLWIIVKGLKNSLHSSYGSLKLGLLAEIIVSITSLSYLDPARLSSLVLLLVMLSIPRNQEER